MKVSFLSVTSVYLRPLTDSGCPYQGVPWVANWMWQAFSDFLEEEPPQSVWEVPEACGAAKACPGW